MKDLTVEYDNGGGGGAIRLDENHNNGNIIVESLMGNKSKSKGDIIQQLTGSFKSQTSKNHPIVIKKNKIILRTGTDKTLASKDSGTTATHGGGG